MTKKIKNSALYVDGFVMMIPKKNITAYKKLASDAGKIWMKHGALSYRECVIDDAKSPKPVMSFLQLAKPTKNEVVLFSYIEFKSKKHRDQVNAKVMKDMDKGMEKYKDKPMPFDTKRMAYGGFKTIVSL